MRLAVYGRVTTIEAQRTPVRDREAYGANVARVIRAARPGPWVSLALRKKGRG